MGDRSVVTELGGIVAPFSSYSVHRSLTKLTPFADDAAYVSISKLTIENGTDRVAIYGSLDLTRDKRGLAHALA